MKVLKFGGTSVGSVKSILALKGIVEAIDGEAIVVVSALGGITDKLISTANMAMAGDPTYKDEFEAMVQRHHDMINTIITDGEKRVKLLFKVDKLFDELDSIYYGLFLIRDLGAKSHAAIVSYGERLSSIIVATLIDGAGWADSRQFIKTEHKHGKNLLNSALTSELAKKAFANTPRITIVPGFISTDTRTGEVTNLGRGGSDYTAAIIASVLDADILEIWTDVNGFMTADPRVIPTAYTIPELSYSEAMELCNFGAKVIYPPTLYPVCAKNIPILVKNTFEPEHPGTIIKDKIANDGKPIKGISSIKGVALITVEGPAMVGVTGVNRRIFTCLANHGVSVFTVSQASSESSTLIGVSDKDSAEAVEALNEEFEKEISEKAILPMRVQTDLSSVAIIGENIRNSAVLPGRLFNALGRSGINVLSIAQGASQTNISVIVETKHLRKSLNVIHDSLLLSEYNELNLFICGIGKVGGNLIEQIRAQYDELMDTHRLKINVVGIANTKHAVFDRDGIDLSRYREILEAAPASGTEVIRDGVVGMNIFNSVFVDCTASEEISGLYQTFLDHNISVVAANKFASAGDYEVYARLKETALRRGVKFLFETNVGAGLPIICTINDLRNSGDKVTRIEAVLSGTLNYIFNTLSKETRFSETVRMAKEKSFTEPDPRVDLSGIDVVRKLVILTREAGYKVNQEDVELRHFLPEDVFEGTLDEFWQKIGKLDDSFEQQRKELEAEKKHLRLVARMDHGKTSVGVEAVDQSHPSYNLEGSNNIILLTTERYNEYPMIIQGYGAGAGVTAAGVFANIMSIANI